ncbi:helix-turn-helix domain-containing protein [Clostridium sp. AF32-12BH]|uniref:helix-turn-helix domain-containing protein n=1 Tax=Clostridium sp. AF32-12BH TaxID=2292006 RepID=UPI000E4E747B|nr:helix-turn-helix domain-containing protein [Clostridium sp. AF32-12BH]RHP46917.1 hypothetical protein DWZ40_08405 [Clostridium sp. AF32-12BH]
MTSKYNNYLKDDEKEKILKMFDEGYNTVDIAKELGRNDCTIGRFLKKNGLQADYRKNGILKSDIKDICELYKSGKSAKEILEKYSDKIKCENTIINIVERNGISARPRGTHVEFNVDYFENIDTEEKAYFLGLFLTDGNVHKVKRNTPQYRIQIGLKYQDAYIIEKFKQEIGSENQISHYERNGRNEAIFGVQSVKMATDLQKYGVYENKTFETELCYKIPDKLFKHYIRGIFDGDGTVFIRKRTQSLAFGFYGTHKLLEQIQEYLFAEANITKNSIYDKSTVSFIINSKKQDIINFYKFIYSDASIYLERKKQVFEKHFQNKNINI